MSSPVRRNALRRAGARIDLPVAAVTWLCGWLVAGVFGTLFVEISGADNADDAPIWALFTGQLLGWIAFVAALAFASQRDGSGDFVADYKVRAKPIDILGAAAGVLTQLVLLPLVYLPLEHLWPSTFDDDKLSQNARDLADRAHGGGLVMLVLMVCVGAPIVEELVYRGLIQGALVNRIQQAAGWVIGAAFFALIHFRPVEYPGLFVAGLVFGACVLWTGRLGPSIAAHVGFNVAGLVLAFH